jgi:hypothetical protein
MSVIPCTKNPIVEYIKYVIQQYELDPASYDDSLYLAFLANTSHTFTSNVNTEYCCPSCGNYAFTFSAGLAEGFISSTADENEGCCLNYNTTNVKKNRFIQMIIAADTYEYENCCNEFQGCSEDLLRLIQSKYSTPDGGINPEYNIGVFEISLLAGETITCALYQYLTTSSLSDTYIYDIIDFIRVYGLVVSCNIGKSENFETTVSTINVD